MSVEYDTLKEFHDYVNKNSGSSADFTEYQIEGKPVISIEWQHGPTKENPRNGAFLEDVLAVVYAQLKALNTEYPSRENSLALTKIEEAVLWLAQRKAERENRGVYGTKEK